jgi:hypothetical protein
MSTTFNETPTLSNPFETITAANEPTAKALQAIATERTDYSKQAFEKCRLHFEKLMGIKKLDEAIQLHSDFAKTAYEDFVAQATKIGEMYANLAKEAFKPLKAESPVLQRASAPPTNAPVAAKQS